ncbi:hypothetical protein DAMA08_011700 [Martiniozyma asiatica (nom. inval.)]|nr:hypothetical protein DAMA08_011700 [Martiniozyma asiatica]
MFKKVFELFKTSPKSIVLSTELIQQRNSLIQHLSHIYTSQIDVLKQQQTLPILKLYTSLLPFYQSELLHLTSLKKSLEPMPEVEFRDLLNTQLDHIINQLELMSVNIKPQLITELEQNYSIEIDYLLKNYHFNRISSTYSIREYLSDVPLIQTQFADELVKKSIQFTEKILELNDYPVPKFIVNCDQKIKSVCIPPHITHIMFELFKNATLPSIKNSKPITVTIYSEPQNDTIKKNPVNFKYNKIKPAVTNKNVVFKISDEGGGMPNELVNKIWHFHYTTSNDSDRDSIHGFGLGLPLCGVFAEFNAGSLKLINEPGVGVTIYLTLPSAA